MPGRDDVVEANTQAWAGSLGCELAHCVPVVFGQWIFSQTGPTFMLGSALKFDRSWHSAQRIERLPAEPNCSSFSSGPVRTLRPSLPVSTTTYWYGPLSGGGAVDSLAISERNCGSVRVSSAISSWTQWTAAPVSDAVQLLPPALLLPMLLAGLSALGLSCPENG